MHRFAIFLAALGVPLAIACGTDATGIETCKKIEEARCRRAPSCPNVSLSQPVHVGSDVDACIRFYDDECLHGLSGSDVSAPKVQACVNAITNGDCSVVAAPETSPDCAWLTPVPVDAGPEAAADGASDATND